MNAADKTSNATVGPLHGLRVVEMQGIGPAPFGCMLLADLGADVVRIERPAGKPQGVQAVASLRRGEARFEVNERGRRSLVLDLRESAAVQEALALIERADVLIEGFRPGVMERLGLGPDVCMTRQPRLIYARITGWGQNGPLAQRAGHDINYIALSGALHAMGRSNEAPVPPLNLVGDYGGGGMLLVVGVLAALFERHRSGCGQVIDAAMTDGAALLASIFYGLKAKQAWSNQRGENLLDGGAHFYDTYVCADGKYVAVGAIEPAFYAQLLERCGIDDPAFAAQHDRHAWPLLKRRLADVLRTRARDEWVSLFEGSDACFAPVLDWDEAPQHAHNRARQTFIEIDGVVQPAPAPRFSRTPNAVPRAPGATTDSAAVLREWEEAPALVVRTK